jgi:hypothetical protein
MADTLNTVLTERGSRYGSFRDNAKGAQAMKRVFQSTPSWALMDDYQREAMEMMASKLSRILYGDPNYDDSWVDLAGYATLVANELKNGPLPTYTQAPAPTVATPGPFVPQPPPRVDLAASTPAGSPMPSAPPPAASPPAGAPVNRAPPPPPGSQVPPPPAGGPVR